MSLTKNWFVFYLVGFLCLGACAPRQKLITLTPHRDLNAVPDTKDYLTLKQDYSLQHVIRFGVDEEHKKLSYRLAKQNIHYVAPERKVEITATLMDLPLIKAYIKSKGLRPGSLGESEIKNQMLRDYWHFTQILVSVDSYVHNYFQWSEWSIWVEDQFGRTYFPRKTKESYEEEKIYPVEKEIMGKKTEGPAYSIHRLYGTLFFQKLDLPALSPLKFVMASNDQQRRVEMNFHVKGPSLPTRPPIELDSLEEALPVAEVPLTETGLSKTEAKRLHFEQATQYYNQKEYEKAIYEWEEVLEIDPNHKLSKIKIEKAQDKLDQLELKRNQYSTQQKKRQMKIHFLLATDHFKEGQYEEAIAEWEEVLSLEPTHELSKKKIKKAKEILANQ